MCHCHKKSFISFSNSLFCTWRLNVAVNATIVISFKSESRFVSGETLLEIRNPQNIDRESVPNVHYGYNSHAHV